MFFFWYFSNQYLFLFQFLLRDFPPQLLPFLLLKAGLDLLLLVRQVGPALDVAVVVYPHQQGGRDTRHGGRLGRRDKRVALPSQWHTGGLTLNTKQEIEIKDKAPLIKRL